MTDLYLIAHKVRNEPAFDIAIMLDVLDEDSDPIWIIPTSGHRAYPWWWSSLSGLSLIDSEPHNTLDGTIESYCGTMPPDLQDHYHLEQTVSTAKQPTLLSRLNLHRTQPPIIRRI